MPNLKRTNFSETEEGVQTKRSLQAMVLDNTYNTAPTYSSNQTLYPDNLISFVEKHMSFLQTHPTVEPTQYLANLRLMTRIR